jgi:hypothetical protein
MTGSAKLHKLPVLTSSREMPCVTYKPTLPIGTTYPNKTEPFAQDRQRRLDYPRRANSL